MHRRLMKLPFGYSLSFYPYRRRNPESRLVRGDLVVNLREAEGAEAPIGLRLIRHDHYAQADASSRARYYPDGPPVRDLRYLDGVVFESVEGPDGAPLPVATFEASVAQPAEAWVEWGLVGPAYKEAAGWSGRGYPAMPWYRAAGGQAIRSPMELLTSVEFLAHMRSVSEPVRVRGDDRSDREPVAAAATAAGLAVIDGTMWAARPGLEPHWEVIEGGDDKVRLELILAREPLSYAHRFRLDRREAAQAFARERAESLGRPFEDTLAQAQIIDPTVLRLDEAMEAARQLMSHLVWTGPGRGSELAVTARSLAEYLIHSDEIALAGQAYALLREATESGMVEMRPAVTAALDRFAEMITLRPELAQEIPRDAEILAGLGR